MAEIAVGGKTQLEVTHADKVKIELAKGQKGTYGWTVTTYAKSVSEAMDALKSANLALISEYGNGNGAAES
jgi:hypothetical protein